MKPQYFETDVFHQHKTRLRSSEYRFSNTVFVILVTEEEVCAGILDSPSPNCLAFSRSLVGVDNYDDPMSAKFFDVVIQDQKKTFDKDKKMRLENLKTTTEEKVSFDKCYKAEWMKTGLAPTESSKNTDYLRKFCHDFKQKMKIKILESVQETNESTQQTFHDEILHHARFSVTRSDRFLGQQTVIEKVKSYLQDGEKCIKPLVLHGPSGCGKTSVMSVLVDKVKDWLGGDTVTMIRFLGTSPHSSDIKSTFLSFINQLCQVYSLTMPKTEEIETEIKLSKYYWKLLNDITCDNPLKNTDELQEPIFRQSKKNMVLFYDSLDQVKFNEVAGLFQWLPSKLPPNVYIITSIASNVNTVQFNDLRKRFLDENQCIEMKALNEQDLALILTNNLARQHRKIDQGQMDVLVHAARQCGWPLYLTLLSNEASKWKSYDVIDQLSLQTTVHGAINKIFHDLEVKYNALFVRTCLGYITVSEGISEVELEDLLSLNDDVLDSVYEFHNPPLEGVIRVPPLLWARVRLELEEFLVEKDVDGATVLSWYHRQFWETAEQRYLRPPIQHTTDKTEDLSLYHKYNQHLADLFMVETPVKRTIHLTRRNYCIEDADRLVTLQPLTAANRRKLIKLPHFLMMSGTIDSIVKLKELILCNPRWLMTKMQGVSYQAVLDDFTLTDFNDTEIRFVLSLLRRASVVLEKNPSELPMEIICRLPRDIQTHPAIQKLVSLSFTLFEEQKALRFFPLFPCLYIPDGHLVATHSGPTHLLVVIVANSSAIIWGPDCGLQVWSLNTHRVIHQLGEPLSLDDIQYSADGREVYHTEGIMLVGWSTDSGNMILSLDILAEEIPSESDLLTTMAVSLDGNYVAVRINDQNMLVDGCGLVIVDVRLRKVVCTTGEGCFHYRIPAVRFLDATKVFYTSVEKSDKQNTTSLVKFDVQSLEMLTVIVHKHIKVKADSVNYVQPSTTLSSDKQELIISCSPDDIIVVSIDTWELRYATLTPEKEEPKEEPDTFGNSFEFHYSSNLNIFNLISFAFLSPKESITLSFNAEKRRSLIRILDDEYNYVTKKINQAHPTISYNTPSMLHVCTEFRLAFVAYTYGSWVDIWDMNPDVRRIIYNLSIMSKPTNMHLDPTTRLLYTSSTDATVKIWDTRQFLASFYEQHSEIDQGEVSAEIEGVSKPEQAKPEAEITGQIHGSVLTGPTTTTANAVLLALEDTYKVATGVTDLVFTRDRRQIYTCYKDKLPIVWDPITGSNLNYVTSTDKIGKIALTNVIRYLSTFALLANYSTILNVN